MKLKEVGGMIYSGQIMSRVVAKEEIGETALHKYKVLVPKSIVNGKVIHNELGEAKLKRNIDEERITQRGDLVIKLSTPYDVAYIDERDEGLVVPSFCAVIRGLDETQLEARFLVAYMNTEYVRETLKSKVAGTSMPMIKLGDIKELDIPKISRGKQKKLGEAYRINCEKQVILRQILENEQQLMDHLMLRGIAEEMRNED